MRELRDIAACASFSPRPRDGGWATCVAVLSAALRLLAACSVSRCDAPRADPDSLVLSGNGPVAGARVAEIIARPKTSTQPRKHFAAQRFSVAGPSNPRRVARAAAPSCVAGLAQFIGARMNSGARFRPCGPMGQASVCSRRLSGRWIAAEDYRLEPCKGRAMQIACAL